MVAKLTQLVSNRKDVRRERRWPKKKLDVHWKKKYFRGGYVASWWVRALTSSSHQRARVTNQLQSHASLSGARVIISRICPFLEKLKKTKTRPSWWLLSWSVSETKNKIDLHLKKNMVPSWWLRSWSVRAAWAEVSSSTSWKHISNTLATH